MEQHGPVVWRTAYRLLNDQHDALDCYQETFLQAVDYERDHQVSSWPAVLRRIATARAMDTLRRRYRSSRVNVSLSSLDEEPAGVELPPEARAQLNESMNELRRALAELPDKHAEVFWLSEVEFLTHHEIAEQLGATAQQVALWLHRAKQKLRKLLTARGMTNEVKR